MNDINVAVIFVQYDIKRYPKSFECFKRKIEASIINSNLKITYVVVDNYADSVFELKNDENLHLISGENGEWEFSGWDRGVKYILGRESAPDVLHFANDAWHAYGWTLLDKISIFNVALSLKNSPLQVVGQIDSKGFPMHINKFDVSEWVCTNNYFMSPHVYRMLKQLTSFTSNELDEIVPVKHEGGVYFSQPSILSTSYQNMVLNWLLNEWHGKFKVSESTWPKFRLKILAMLNESMLTARIKGLGCHTTSYSKFI